MVLMAAGTGIISVAGSVELVLLAPLPGPPADEPVD